MIVLRFLIVLMVISVLVCLGAFLVTQHRGYLRLAWQIIRFSGVLLLAALLLFAISRVILL
jgi:hypothetical protein